VGRLDFTIFLRKDTLETLLCNSYFFNIAVVTVRLTDILLSQNIPPDDYIANIFPVIRLIPYLICNVLVYVFLFLDKENIF